MLRLLTELRQQWPLTPVHCLGVVPGRDSVRAVYTEGGQERPKVVRSWNLPLSGSLFTGPPGENEFTALTNALRQIHSELPDPYARVQLALPDAAGHHAIFEVDSVPEAEDKREAFARWRLENEYRLDANGLELKTQVLNGAKPHLLYIQAMERGWVEAIQHACREAGLLVSVIDKLSNYRFTAAFNGLSSGRAMALVLLGKEDWTLQVADEHRRPRILRSRWRNPAGETSEAEEYSRIAREVEQQLGLLEHAANGCRVRDVYVCAGAEDVEALLGKISAQGERHYSEYPLASMGVELPETMVPGTRDPSLLATGVRR